MASLTVYVSDIFRTPLLEQLRDNSPFRTVLCVNSCAECCPDAPAARTDALIIELSCTTSGHLQDLMQQMESSAYCPAMLLFESLEDGSIRYAVSAPDELQHTGELEKFFTDALRPERACSRWFFRSVPWPEENTLLVSGARSRALVELMYGASQQETQYYIDQYCLDLRERGYYAYYWELNYTLYIDHYCYKDIYSFIGSAMLEACRRIIEKYNGGEVFYINLTQVCVLINDFRLSSETQNRRRLNALLAELTSVTTSGRASHYVSQKFRSIRDLRTAYDTYLAERRMSFFAGDSQIFDSSVRRDYVEADPAEINRTLDVITRYLNYDINNIVLDEALRHLFFDVLKPSCDFPMYYYAASVLSSKLLQADPTLDKRLISKQLDASHLNHSSIEKEYSVFCRTVENVRRQIGGVKQSKSALMMKAMDFIRNNYRENILVSDIANALYVSETYLSRIFKMQTGKSVIQNLIDFRIAQAKLALAEEDVAIYAIAEQCGFRDVRHFSKTFKKMTGMSPTEYRRGHF